MLKLRFDWRAWTSWVYIFR